MDAAAAGVAPGQRAASESGTGASTGTTFSISLPAFRETE
jgi:hypothetical protein